MKKTVTTYIYFITLILTAIAFLFLLISHYLITLIGPEPLLQTIIFLACAAVFSLIITIGLSVFDSALSEAVFTSRRMQRFESLSNPLLLKLSTEASGTYHHSLNVSNLAQKAAKSIGADSLLVRTAAYYHDIGKLFKPSSFVENQSSREIPTDDSEASIKKNARLIISHVEEGIKIARHNHLSEELIDMIAQHHGTTRALYFYEKARERGLKIQKTDFRYPGPTPLSREAAVLMLADAVEATARALPSLSADNIKKIVENTVSDKTAENQFKNARLSEFDLERIGQALTETLLSIYHQRIEYKHYDQNQSY